MGRGEESFMITFTFTCNGPVQSAVLFMFTFMALCRVQVPSPAKRTMPPTSFITLCPPLPVSIDLMLPSLSITAAADTASTAAAVASGIPQPDSGVCAPLWFLAESSEVGEGSALPRGDAGGGVEGALRRMQK